MNDTKQPEISIYMAVYNGEKYLGEALDSILAQTFKNFELIIADDGSTDGSLEIAKKYEKQDTRIKVFSFLHRGVVKTQNDAIKHTNPCSKYLVNHDSDDISLSERFELQKHFLDFHPGVGVVGGAMEVIDDQNVFLGKRGVFVEHEIIKAHLLVNNFSFYHPTTMVRRNLMQELGGYNEERELAEDYDLWWRFSHLSHLANLPDVLVRYRRHDKSITMSQRKLQLQMALKVSLNAIHESLKDKFLDGDAYRRFWWTYHSQHERLDVDNIKLQRNDIKQLQPFWGLLASYPKGPEVWGPRFLKFACYLIVNRQAREGFQLLKVLKEQLKQPIKWKHAAKCFVKYCIQKLKKIIKKNQEKSSAK